MSGFKQLRDISNNFENDLKRLSTELFSVKIGESFEEHLAKKYRDLALFRSKLCLLRAKCASNDPEQTEQDLDEATTLERYEESASNKVLEQQIVKFLTECHSVKAVITAPSSSLDPELVDRKEKITEGLAKFRLHELQLRHLQTVLKEKQEELDSIRGLWDAELGQLRDSRDGVDEGMDEEPGPLHRKLRMLVEKMELMRWLLSKLVTSRTGGYDWLGDPHWRLRALALARETCTIEDFLES